MWCLAGFESQWRFKTYYERGVLAERVLRTRGVGASLAQRTHASGQLPIIATPAKLAAATHGHIQSCPAAPPTPRVSRGTLLVCSHSCRLRPCMQFYACTASISAVWLQVGARARRRGRALAGHELVECAVPDRARIQLAVERVVHQPEHGHAALVRGAESGRRARQHLLAGLLLPLEVGGRARPGTSNETMCWRRSALTQSMAAMDDVRTTGRTGHLVCLVQACVKGLYLYLYL